MRDVISRVSTRQIQVKIRGLRFLNVDDLVLFAAISPSARPFFVTNDRQSCLRM